MIYLLLLLFFVVEYVRPTSYVPALLVLKLNSLIPISAAIGSLFLAKGRVATEQLLTETNTKLMFSFLGLLMLSVVTAEVTDYAWTMFMAVLGYVLIYWVIAQQVTDLDRLKGVFKVLVLVHLIITALNPQIFGGDRAYIASGAFLGDGNDFALSVNIAIPLCLFLVFDATKAYRRVFYLAALLLLVLDVVVTQSRGGTVALVCVAFYYWLKSDRKLTMAMVAVVAVTMVLAVAPGTYFERMSSVGDTEEGSAKGRIEAWKAGIAMAIDNPLLGVGAGHFAVMHGARYRNSADSPPNQTAHSIYFLILGDLGLPGITLLISFFVLNFAENKRLAEECARAPDSPTTRSNRQLLAAVNAALLAYATGGAFLSAVYYPHMAVLAGLQAAARRVVRTRIAETSAVAAAPTVLSPQPVAGLSPYFVPRQAALPEPRAAGSVGRTRRG